MIKLDVSHIINNILTDAISAITILEVKSNKTIEGDYVLYIKTNDISTIDMDLLKELVHKNSNDYFLVEFLIPETKFIDNIHQKNLDTICIFVKYK